LKEEWAVIHLPLRTNYRQDNPVLSSIQICSERQTVLDLFGLPLKAGVLVATECGHLPGQGGKGDEVVALTRSLLFSGPKALVLPLWRTRPEPERLFLDSFYGALGEDFGVLGALETARRTVRSRYPHPGDWAAWVSFGA
jgi:CHAT domain-containing protein